MVTNLILIIRQSFFNLKFQNLLSVIRNEKKKLNDIENLEEKESPGGF
jgi:hypothetical protein